ncbi:peptidase S1 [Tyrophagus putrescentiae]|nr:peptidase S1 [Tyrophagus putrescentiae]
MLHFSFLLLLLLSPLSSSSAQFAQFRIVGGEEVTSLLSVPFAVSFNATDDQNGGGGGGGGIFCSGVLISCRTVLTAAHCLLNRSVASIRLGSLRYGSGGRRQLTSRQFTLHPQYNPATQENDIALLYLAGKAVPDKAQFRRRKSYSQSRKGLHLNTGQWGGDAVTESKDSTHASPICLPTSFQQSQSYLSSRLLTVAGWGQQVYSVQALSPVLQSISVASIPISTCHRLYRKNVKGIGTGGNAQLLARFTAPDADRRILCAHWPERAICLGDSGGALKKKQFILLGIASETLECGRNGVPDIYTRVDAYLHWISAHQL